MWPQYLGKMGPSYIKITLAMFRPREVAIYLYFCSSEHSVEKEWDRTSGFL